MFFRQVTIGIDASFALSLACQNGLHSIAKILLFNKFHQTSMGPPSLAYVSKERLEADWSGLSIQTIPEDWLGEIVGFKKFFLCRNVISELPSCVNMLRCLVQLDVQYNNLTSVPGEVFQMPALRNLTLSHNRITGSVQYAYIVCAPKIVGGNQHFSV